ncbi:hypothetical protein DERP_008284 [Dermatophagoides pteronyssinus]|uniref:Fatty acyl-CoA reductase n=1 Tax=Dermatophagoides pteronyssinus TaxID=6956 RepID=A0ABQ8J631_DERPT|nr:hypothetical protein DERP_008284 [Dermatophagoides pteronyssinus]
MVHSSLSSSSTIDQQQKQPTAISIRNFYNGKSIFLTGGSGFIGKVLIEKLLYSCPEIERIYLLIRPSRDGKSPQQRLEEEVIKSRVFTFRNKAFDFSKLVAVNGDMTKPRLGLSDSDYQTLIENVSIVFHSAATVRFHGPLKKFVTQNIHGTESVMKLSRDMKKLQTVVYVSTAYANCNLIDVEEKVYPLADDIESLINKIINEDSDEAPSDGHPSLMGRPNSYTISKAIAECLVASKYSDLPVVICRPSIVSHAYREPAEGWCDSLNGVAGALLLGGLGIARTMEMRCDYISDIIPVDFVANSLIVIGYHSSLYPEKRPKVIHITSGHKNPISWAQILNYSRMAAVKTPSVKMVRPIAQNPISAGSFVGRVNHRLTMFFSHILFAYIFDFILLICRQKRVMVDVTNKMHRALEVLKHFTNHQWFFRNDNYSKIFQSLPDDEKHCYQSNVEAIDWTCYCNALWMGSRRYLINEDDSTLKDGIRRHKILKLAYGLLDLFIYTIILSIFGYIISLLMQPNITIG